MTSNSQPIPEDAPVTKTASTDTCGKSGGKKHVGSDQTEDGVLRIDRENKTIKVFVNGQAAVPGTTTQVGQLVGFEIEVVNGKNGALFFTDFKIAR
jgi:hypothetical protein